MTSQDQRAAFEAQIELPPLPTFVERYDSSKLAEVVRNYALRAVVEAIAHDRQQHNYVDSTPHLRVGDSSFESWFSGYNPAGNGSKQQARDAYAAGMGDPLVCDRQQRGEAVKVAAQPSVPDGLIAALRNQRQIDRDGSEVAVSRRAFDEAADLLDRYVTPSADRQTQQESEQ